MAQQGTSRSARSIGEDAATTIPDKLYFRIGEVAVLCGVPTYVLRFWESEFPQLKPNKGGTGQRLYRKRDVETALHIRTLLYEGKFTIAGARQVLKTEQRQKEPQLSLAIVENEAPSPARQTAERKALRHLRDEMRELLDVLASPAGATRRASVHPMKLRATKPVRQESGSELETLFS